MEDTILPILAILLFVVYLGRSKFKLDDATIGVDNPYYDNEITTNSMPLDKYEKELDVIFDYDSVKNRCLDKDLDSITDEFREKDEDLTN